jgi:hypothetical protein
MTSLRGGVKLTLMKKLSLYIFLVLMVFSNASAETKYVGTKFTIEGMSLGDSLLDYFSEEKINSNLRDFYKDKRFSVTLIEDLKSHEFYDYVQIHFKTNDNKYIIHAIDGMIDINYNACLKRQKKTDKDLTNTFKNAEREGPVTYKHDYDDTGKSKVASIFYRFKSGDRAEVSCYDFAEHIKFPDGFNVAISTKEIIEWLNTKESEY